MRLSTSENLLAALFVVIFVGGILALKGCWAEHVYGDWTCAFSECRREVKL